MSGGALRALLGLSYRCGGPRLWEVVRGGRTKILMYHGITATDRFDGIVNHYGYNVPLAEFEAQLDYLRRHCSVVSLRDFLAGRGLSRRGTNVVLTFDDGYENNFTNALPVLQRLGLPATFAVATAFVAERRPLYNDVVEFAVQRCAHQRVRLRLTDGEREFRLGDYAGRLELYDWVMYECIRMDQSQRDAFLTEVLEELDVAADAEVMFENPDYRPLAPAQVRQMAASDLVEIASHSVNHYLLSSADTPTKRFELRESKRVLEAMTGAPCTAFCVPGGKYDREMVEEAYAAGYQAVLCSDVGTAVRGQRVLKRNGVFRQPDLHWFADVVRGPVHELVRAAGRARAKFKAG